MRARALLLPLAAAVGLSALLSPCPEALAGVPRACVREHPAYDREACALANREELRQVVPLVRLRTLDAERERQERVMPLQDAERNRLLREIRDALHDEDAERAPR